MKDRKTHRLVSRQLRRSGLNVPESDGDPLAMFIDKVSNSYHDADQTRALLEHSIKTTSKELTTLNDELQKHRDQLEIEVTDRTNELRQAKALFEILSESSPLGIFQADSEWNFVYVNQSLMKTFQQDEDGLLGKKWRRQIHYEDYDRVLEFTQGEFDHEDRDFHFRLIVAQEIRHIRLQYNATCPSSGGQVTYVGIAEDITHAIEYEESLLRAKEAAELATRTKDEFLANMSHELRTPLHGILSFATLGANKIGQVKADKIARYFSRISESGNSLLMLLNDLLDLAKLESGKMSFQFEDKNIVGIIETVLLEFQVLGREKNVNIRADVQADIEVVRMDSHRITQVVRNLVSNAVKFTAESSEVVVAARDLGDRVTISVEDEGIGIPQDELEAVFDKFIQSSKTNSGAGGTGLGLAISREIITAHNGRIWAENRSGSGACFVFEIPLEGTKKPASSA